MHFIGLPAFENTYMKTICKISFTLWFGYGWKFPKRLTRTEFRHQRCIPFIDVALTACNNMIHLVETNWDTTGKIIKYYMRKIIYILSYEIIQPTENILNTSYFSTFIS